MKTERRLRALIIIGLVLIVVSMICFRLVEAFDDFPVWMIGWCAATGSYIVLCRALIPLLEAINERMAEHNEKNH